jgi:hypothetical protein
MQKGTMSRIETFALENRLHLTKDICGDPIVQGRLSRDANIGEFDDTHLTMSFVTDGKQAARTGLFNKVRNLCIAAGMKLHQGGDAEGIFVFDPCDRAQAVLAMRSIRARVKRRVSEVTKIRLSEVLVQARAIKQLLAKPSPEFQTKISV